MIFTKNILGFILFLLLCSGVCQFSAAQDLIDTDRPDQTESAYTLPKHWLQFETGFNFQKNATDNYEFLNPTLLSKYGLTRKIEFRVITKQIPGSATQY